MNSSLKRSDMTCDGNGITQFYLPPTHEPYLPLLPSCRALPPWLVLIGPTHGGMARLSWPGWLVAKIGFRHRELNPDRSPIPVLVTSLIEINALPVGQTANTVTVRPTTLAGYPKRGPWCCYGIAQLLKLTAATVAESCRDLSALPTIQSRWLKPRTL